MDGAGAVMSTTWSAVTAGLGRRRRRWSTALRRGFTGLLLGGGLALLVAGGADHNHVLARAGLPVLLLAVTWQVWRAPEHDLPQALRVRRVSRRIGLRLASLSLVAAALGTVVGLPGTVSLWLLAAAPVPVLLEAALWRLAPRSLRREVRTGQNAEELLKLGVRVEQRRPLGFDPDLGVYGRPVPHYRAGPPLERSRHPYLVSPYRSLAPRPSDGAFTPAEERWLRRAGIQWTGRELGFTDGRGRRTREGDLPGKPAELVLFAERSVVDRRTEQQVFLLDAEGWRLLTVPGLGQDHSRLRGLAEAAGLRYTEHRIVVQGRLFETPLATRLFPRRRGHVRLRIR